MQDSLNHMLKLDMRQLEYFAAAASSGSFSSAAKRLFVSPQAISKGVQILEHSIGASLFDRGPNGIELTAFGALFYEEAKTVLESLDRLQNMAARYQRENAVPLNVGIQSLCLKENGGTIDWNDLLAFSDAHSDAAPVFLEMRGDSIIESVASGEVDFGISVLDGAAVDEFDSMVLHRFPLAAVLPRSEADFAHKKAASIKELASGHLMLFPEDNAFNSFFTERARKEKLKLKLSSLRISTVNDIDFIKGRNLYTVRPYQHATRTMRSDHTRILPILDADGNQIAMPLSIFWQKGKKLLELEEQFVAMIVSLYRTAKHPQPAEA